MNSVAATTALDSPLARSRLREKICSEFERAWKSGERPALRERLYDVVHEDRAALLAELLPIEVHYRRKAGENPTSNEYSTECREQAAVVADFFATQAATPSAAMGAATPSTTLPAAPGYVVHRELGRGGMGVVYLARQLQPRRWVALKMLKDKAAGDPLVRQRFRTEWDAIARLQHPNILPIYAVGEAGDRAFMALEFAEGGGLDRFLSGTPLKPGPAARLTEQLARAVSHAHDSGIIHRDLKPGNVLLQPVESRFQRDNLQGDAATPTPTPGHQAVAADLACLIPKISDFGLAKCRAEQVIAEYAEPAPRDESTAASPTLLGERLGTPSYMAPEQARGDHAAVGPLTDVYSLGAILYELLTGRPPFIAPTAAATLDLLLTSDAVPPRQLQPTVPRDLEVICLKCLEKLPDRRYASAADLAEDLRRFQSGEAIIARPEGRIEKVRRWGRRHPVQLAILICLVVGVVGQSIALLLLREANRRAEANFLQAIEVSRTTLNLVNDDPEMTNRGLYCLRDKVLTELTARGEAFIAQQPENRLLRREIARAYTDLSRARVRLGDNLRGVQAIDRAVELRAQLVAEDDTPVDRIEWAVGRCQRARVYFEMLDRPRAAKESVAALAVLNPAIEGAPPSMAGLLALAECRSGLYLWSQDVDIDHLELACSAVESALTLDPNSAAAQKLAMEIWQRMVTRTRGAKATPEVQLVHIQTLDKMRRLREQYPARPDLDAEYVRALVNIAARHCDDGRIDDAIVQVSEAITLIDRLITLAPEVATYRWFRALAFANRGEARRYAGDLDAADADFRGALATFEALLPLAVENKLTRIEGSVLNAFAQYAKYAMERGRSSEAWDYQRRAEAIGQQIPAHPPEYATLLRADLLANLAQLHAMVGELELSLAAWDRAAMLVGNDLAQSHLPGWCPVAVRMGQVDEAIAAADKLALGRLDEQMAYDLARAYALAAVEKPASRAELIERSLVMLRRADTEGYFPTPYLRRVRLANCRDFEVLANHSEFKRLQND